MVITSDVSFYGGKVIPLKEKVDAAAACPTVQHVIVYDHGHQNVSIQSPRDLWWHEVVNAPDLSDTCPPAIMNSEDPLFILYTSGSTGRPKAIRHTTAGYLLQAHLTFRWLFDIRSDDIHYCTADVGWITGHSYVVYGPLSCGVTSVIFEGTPTCPTPDRFWRLIERHRVNIFYTAPTAIRALMQFGDHVPQQFDLSSLHVLGSVGEPINEAAWHWYWRVIGQERCPVLDTWWQTETGAIMIAPFAGITPLQPGSATKPFFGVAPAILKSNGQIASIDEPGSLVITKPWPSMLRGIHGDQQHRLFQQIYFSQFSESYTTGDGARLDHDSNF